MGKGSETGFAMVGSHSAGAHTSKGQVRHAELHHHVVETHATGAGGAQQMILVAVAAAEQVKSQRFVLLLNPLNSLIQVCDLQDR
ncbi:MAG: Uncharacterised protein [Cyanobium sp. ARS6]|nr:MAG: Uncharacterised protein [Cyanobium sp. ARS6]